MKYYVRLCCLSCSCKSIYLTTYFCVRGFGQQGPKGALDPVGKGFVSLMMRQSSREGALRTACPGRGAGSCLQTKWTKWTSPLTHLYSSAGLYPAVFWKRLKACFWGICKSQEWEIKKKKKTKNQKGNFFVITNSKSYKRKQKIIF